MVIACLLSVERANTEKQTRLVDVCSSVWLLVFCFHALMLRNNHGQMLRSNFDEFDNSPIPTHESALSKGSHAHEETRLRTHTYTHARARAHTIHTYKHCTNSSSATCMPCQSPTHTCMCNQMCFPLNAMAAMYRRRTRGGSLSLHRLHVQAATTLECADYSRWLISAASCVSREAFSFFVVTTRMIKIFVNCIFYPALEGECHWENSIAVLLG